MTVKITLLPGDGIGPEIVDATVCVMDAAAKKFGFTLDYDKELLGGCAIDAYGDPFPSVTEQAAHAADAVLLGAVGGPKWDHVDPSLRPEKGLLRIRKSLGLYCNLRPMKVSRFTTHLSPLKEDRVAGTDLLIVRELTGGIYFGTHQEAALVDGVETASDIDLYTRPEVERIARKAFEAARKRRGRVTSVDKANVLAESRLWRRIVTDMQAREYPDVELNHFYVDNCAMQLVLNPRQFDVILTNNIFGDILSDEASVLGGSIGLLPSASLGDGTGLYEPIHGSAPDIAGQGIANPTGTILSAAMLFRYSLNQPGAADAVEAAVDAVYEAGYRTPDLAGAGLTTVRTAKLGALVAQAVLDAK
ncbi:MAG: 3-isopropylmalate dehydrogenase [Succiniclasticum sp.]|nr:3-isopropylmalate dehydrogenase [Succiniclasticum sp.]